MLIMYIAQYFQSISLLPSFSFFSLPPGFFFFLQERGSREPRQTVKHALPWLKLALSSSNSPVIALNWSLFCHLWSLEKILELGHVKTQPSTLGRGKVSPAVKGMPDETVLQCSLTDPVKSWLLKLMKKRNLKHWLVIWRTLGKSLLFFKSSIGVWLLQGTVHTVNKYLLS